MKCQINFQIVVITPKITVNTNEIPSNALEMALNTLEIAPNALEMILNTPQMLLNTPKMASNTPEMVPNALEMVLIVPKPILIGIGHSKPWAEALQPLPANPSRLSTFAARTGQPHKPKAAKELIRPTRPAAP